MDETLEKETSKIRKIGFTSNGICTTILKQSIMLASTPKLSQHATAFALTDLINIVRESTRTLIYGKTVIPSSGYKPLLTGNKDNFENLFPEETFKF